MLKGGLIGMSVGLALSLVVGGFIHDPVLGMLFGAFIGFCSVMLGINIGILKGWD